MGRESEEKLLKELSNELTELREEVSLLSERAQTRVESHWDSFKSEVAPCLEAWSRACALDGYVTLKITKAGFGCEKSLSSITLKDKNIFAGLSNCGFSNSVQERVMLSLASRNLEIDYENKMLVLPVIIFDNVNAVIVAKGDLKVDAYSEVCAHSKSFLEEFRNIVLHKKSPAFADEKKVG